MADPYTFETLPEGEWVDETFGGSSNMYYQFTISKPGLVTIHYVASTYYLKLYMYSDTEMTNMLWYDVSPKSNTYSCYLEAGTYAIRVYKQSYGSANLSLKYTYTAADEENDVEPNDSTEQAIALKYDTKANGLITLNSTNDFYKFTAVENTEVTVTCGDGEGGRIYVYVLNDSYKSIYDKGISSNSSYVISEDNVSWEAGKTYYLKLSGKETHYRYNGPYSVLLSEGEVELEGISLDSTATVGVDKSKTLKVTYNPTNASNKALTWTSEDESVVKVEDGKITGVSVLQGKGNQPGSVTVTATSEDGGYTASCEVTTLFNDVMNSEAYYFEPIYWAYNNDITTGKRGGATFAPSETCTRAQIVTFLWRLSGEPEPNVSNPFKDISKKAYYYKAVLWAYEMGITTGRRGGNTFDPNATCTRREIVTFLWRYAGEPEPTKTSGFKDVKNSNAYYFKAVYWAAEKGITTGKRGGKNFDPTGNCTRAMSVTFIYRYKNQ